MVPAASRRAQCCAPAQVMALSNSHSLAISTVDEWRAAQSASMPTSRSEAQAQSTGKCYKQTNITLVGDGWLYLAFLNPRYACNE